jgi:general secretion pathway protein A
MKRVVVIVVSVFSVSLAMGLAPPGVFADTETVETGRLLAILHDSGRVTIAGIQPLINDPEKGDKGFTPEVFEQKLIEKFKERSEVDLTKLKNEKVPEQAKKLLPMLVEAGKKVVATYQPILNKQGLGYKNFIPATWGTRAAAIFTARTGSYIKQTTFDNVLRNPRNKADDFEASVLKKFADPSYPRQGEQVISETVDGGKAVRLLLPLFHVKGCLPCHGEPKNERDISGYLREGAKLGELAGAISVKLSQK